MNKNIFILFFSCLITGLTYADIIKVRSQAEFNTAHDDAARNDTIMWPSGTYSDIFMDIEKDYLYITAEVLGETVFTGSSRADITGDYVTLRGFQYLNGDIGTKDVINTRGSYNTFTQINIRAYRSYKYLRVREESQYAVISYCNFENRLNLDDQNILSLLVDDNQPGYHKVQYCSFKNFDGTGNDMGIEPIRIGVSTQAEFISRSLVEYCYFTQCNGDGEIISNKARQNVFRFNTFENNPKSELVLRHGSENIVYSNFFLNGKGGVRVREGQDQYIYNNYFYNIDDRVIFLQNEDSDPLDNINVAFNTIINCSEVILGGDGNNKPTNVTFSNNIFTDPMGDLFDDATGSETWYGNIAFGNLGITLPLNGLTVTDPILEENSAGFFGLSEFSPAIDASKSGFKRLPNFAGIDNIDINITSDLMGERRPSLTNEKDLGCSEYNPQELITPIATEENTGPSYNTTETPASISYTVSVKNLIKIHPNPAQHSIQLTNLENGAQLEVVIYTLEGREISTFSSHLAITEISLDNLPAGVYTLKASSKSNAGITRIQTAKFIKLP
jgi:hypothetical protein